MHNCIKDYLELSLDLLTLSNKLHPFDVADVVMTWQSEIAFRDVTIQNRVVTRMSSEARASN